MNTANTTATTVTGAEASARSEWQRPELQRLAAEEARIGTAYSLNDYKKLS